MEYDVVGADSNVELAKSVMELIAEGWRPLSGVSVVYNQSEKKLWFWQSVVRKDQ